MKKIIGLIPAAGKGSRLGLPFPKELYPVVAGNSVVPVAAYAMSQIDEVTNRCVVVITPDKHQLMEYYSKCTWIESAVRYVVQGNGTDLADAVRWAYPAIRGKRVAFAMPDTIIWPEWAMAELDQQMTDEDDMVMGLFVVSDPSKFGMVSTWNGYATGVYDKQPASVIPYAWGCLLWQPKFTEMVWQSRDSFAELLNEIVQQGHTKVVEFDKPDHHYYDLGTVDGIKEYLSDKYALSKTEVNKCVTKS